MNIDKIIYIELNKIYNISDIEHAKLIIFYIR